MTDFGAARDDLQAFAEMAGRPLTDRQASSLQLAKRVTVVVAPRQSGKSRSMAVLALHQAFRRPRTRVLIVSAGEEAARRLLADVRSIASGSALLRGSVADETAGLLTLTNGSEVRSVPNSEKQVRGWTVDLLLVDEASMVSDELILGAAFPTVAARPDARIVMASSASAASGAFYDHVILGRQGSEYVAEFAWRLTDAPWVSSSSVEHARASMSPTMFAAEYEGVFASGADSLFPRGLLERATADYVMPGMRGLGRCAGLAGVDWGVTTDRSALVVLGRVLRPEGLFVVPVAHAWRSGEPLDAAEDAVEQGVVGQIAGIEGELEQITMEVNGVGYPLAQALARRLRAGRGRRCPLLEFRHTTAEMKSATYGGLRMLLEQGRLALPLGATDLLRELLLLRVSLNQTGGEKIEAGVGHDDLADSLMLAMGPYQDYDGKWHSRLGDAARRVSLSAAGDFDCETVFTGAGLEMPREPVPTEVGVPRGGVSVVSRFLSETPPVTVSGELVLVGKEHVDLPSSPGFHEAAEAAHSRTTAADMSRRRREQTA